MAGDKVKFELVSPERLLMSAEADMVVVPGSDGDFGVLPGHSPLMSALRPGLLEVHGGDGEPERFFIRGGFAEVTPEGLTVLAERALPMAELDAESLGGQIRNAREDVDDAETDARRDDAQRQLDQLEALLEVLD